MYAMFDSNEKFFLYIKNQVQGVQVFNLHML